MLLSAQIPWNHNNPRRSDCIGYLNTKITGMSISQPEDSCTFKYILYQATMTNLRF